MGLTYHYKFRVPANRTSAELKAFLESVEIEAKRLGFNPTLVLEAPFDTPERHEFARRLTHGWRLESEALKTSKLSSGQTWHLDSTQGACRVIPKQGVILIITGEQGCETILGFFRYPAALQDVNGREVVQTGAGDGWVFEDFIKTPDPRLRALVRHFAEAGYLEEELDEFRPTSAK